MKNKGAIAAGSQQTVEAGAAMFDLGGNAFDAAVSAVLTSFVVESTLTSVGGGGFMLAYTADRRKILFDFFSQTPLQKKKREDLDFKAVQINFGGAMQTFHIGLGSIATPSNLAGICCVHRQLGRLPFSTVIEPAIYYARKGFTLNSFQGFCHSLLEPILTGTPTGKEIYAPQGNLLREGDICYMSALGDILTEIGKKGMEVFYRGDLAQQIGADMKNGGYLTIDDLANYRVELRQPLEINYRGYGILTNPPPSSGGILIAFALKMLEKIDLQDIEFGSKEHLEILAAILRSTNQARREEYDDNIYRENIEKSFLDTENLDRYQPVNKWGSTNHISVIDNEGNAASVTTSNGEGSSYIVPNTGIMLNNMLGEADLNPRGFHQWQCNRRVSSMMSPTIVLKDGKPEIVLGSGGSNRIRTAILQVISNLIDFRQSLDDAVQNPRMHWEENLFHLEPSANVAANRETIASLRLPPSTQTNFWKEKNMFFGGVNAVGCDRHSLLQGVGDIRRGGVSSVVQSANQTLKCWLPES
jgi:gamma-glutamyltranspeptidase / glutathione hydrolase